MKIAFIIVDVIIVLFALFLLALKGRTKKDLSYFLKFRYAHRGLHNKPTVPENSLAAFKAAVDNGYAIELDVHLMSDGEIAVIHDSSLKRTAGHDVLIENLKTEDLANYKLEESDEKIPTLREVFDLVDGKVPLLVEIKTENNCAAVSKRTVEMLREYKGPYVVESFDPRCILWLKKHAPDIIRGQLTQNFIRHKSGFKFITKVILSGLLLNCINKPDFIAVNYIDRHDFPIKIATKFWGVKKFVWTIREEEDLKVMESEGFTPIFEQFNP